MEYETYVAMRSNDMVEYGFSFNVDGDHQFDLVLGEVTSSEEAVIEPAFELHRWAAEAICNAAP